MALQCDLKTRPVSDTPRARLKRVTDPVHQALHRHPIAVAISDRGSCTALKVLLQANLSLLRQLEANTPHRFQSDIGHLMKALQRDLPEVSVSVGTQTDAPLDRAVLAGSTYVALGSMMGGKTLLKAMQRTAFAPFPDRYLRTQLPLEWWRWLLSELDGLAAYETQWATVELAALGAFAQIEAALDAGVAAIDVKRHQPSQFRGVTGA
jgi:heme oxygenase